jgi:hypothetical protein
VVVILYDVHRLVFIVETRVLREVGSESLCKMYIYFSIQRVKFCVTYVYIVWYNMEGIWLIIEHRLQRMWVSYCRTYSRLLYAQRLKTICLWRTCGGETEYKSSIWCILSLLSAGIPVCQGRCFGLFSRIISWRIWMVCLRFVGKREVLYRIVIGPSEGNLMWQK